MTRKRRRKSMDHKSDTDELEDSDDEASTSSSTDDDAPLAKLNPDLLLPLLRCTLCIDNCDPAHQPSLNDPVTLPCGHTICRIHLCNQTPAAPSGSSMPPAVPLTRQTGCPLPGCSYATDEPPRTQLQIHPDANVVSFPSPVAQRPRHITTPRPTQPESVPKTDITVARIQGLVSAFQNVVDDQPSTDLIPHPKRRRLVPGGRNSNADAAAFSKSLQEIITCGICFMIFYEPLTLTCGHTFCAKCLQRALDNQSSCPFCRQNLPQTFVSMLHFLDVRDREPPVNKVILGILLLAFPQDYVARREALIEEAFLANNSRLDTPIYVSTQCAFPGLKLLLKFIEPNQRLMLRRVLATPSTQFGMMLPPRGVTPQPSGIVHGYGTIMRIRSVQLLPDNGSIVEAEGVGVLRVLESGKVDGFVISRIKRIEDVSSDLEPWLTSASAPAPTSSPSHPPAPSSSLTSTETATSSAPPALDTAQSPVSLSPDAEHLSNEELLAICRSFVEGIRADTAPFVVKQLNNDYGDEPQDDPVAFVWWMVSLLPIDDYEKIKLLPIRSPQLRLRLCAHWVMQFKDGWWYDRGCIIC